MNKFTKILAMVISISTLNAFSQGQSELSLKKNELKGFYAGLEYANLTDVRIDAKFTFTDGTTQSETTKSGTHLGVAGFSVGYRMLNVNDNPITVSGGLRILQSFNKSEYGDDKVTFYIPEGTIGYLVTEKFEGFAGLSIPVIRGSNTLNKYQPRGGLSLGLSANFTPSFSVKAAYNAYLFKFDDKFETTKAELDLALAGLAVSTQFMF